MRTGGIARRPFSPGVGESDERLVKIGLLRRVALIAVSHVTVEAEAATFYRNAGVGVEQRKRPRPPVRIDQLACGGKRQRHRRANRRRLVVPRVIDLDCAGWIDPRPNLVPPAAALNDERSLAAERGG